MAATTLVTADELLRLPDDGRQRRELVKGEVVTMAPPGYQHGEDTLALASPLRAFARQGNVGSVVVETGFCLERDPDTVRAPDVAFVSAERLPPPDQRSGYFDGAPDLAVEVVSPHDAASEVLEKVQEYLTAGCRLVWVVDSRTRTVMVYRANGTVELLREADTLSGEDVVPGFALAIRDIFA